MSSDVPARDLHAIHNLKARYCRYVDTRQWDRLIALFTPDCSYEGLWATADGPSAFVDNLRSNLGPDVETVHQVFNPELVCAGVDLVHGVWGMHDYLRWPVDSRAYLGVKVPGQTGIRGWGYYEETYERTRGGWAIAGLRLARLRIEPVTDEVVVPEFPFVRPRAGWLEAMEGADR